MGFLKGDASILPVGDLLQQLSAARKAGTLALQRGEEQKMLYLHPDGMKLLRTSSPRTTSLGEILIRTGKITRAELDPMIEEQRKTGRRLGEIVARLGKVTKQDIQNALREQVEEEIYDVFSWSDASFEFVEGAAPPAAPENPMSEIVLDANPTSILLEAARRADEMATIMRVIRDESLVPFRTTHHFLPHNLGVSPDLLTAVYREINGRASVTEVVRRSLHPRFHALRAMYVLLTKEFAQLLDREGATAVVLEHETKKKTSTVRRVIGAAKLKPILLLGDMPKYRGALATILRSAGYVVIEELTSGMIGLMAQKGRIEVVILDVSIKIDDGFVFCSWLRDNLGAPIIVLSADASREAGMRALESGARAYVVKPFTAEVILRSVGNVLQPSPA